MGKGLTYLGSCPLREYGGLRAVLVGEHMAVQAFLVAKNGGKRRRCGNIRIPTGSSTWPCGFHLGTTQQCRMS